ncbi:nucleotidyltransferase family protein [Pseudomonas segetis]|uniref:Nucleotidyltransferase family protein n=1 Tax=Pseudomonas segetis TaxID=298908 RepID=A0A238ZP86_9PSED|nr:nucleotidyltransferase family protein [Pseudomonas segetis]SNR85185.1 hypothetical protein SAMN05216255_0591 [Pseudomonas segetis]
MDNASRLQAMLASDALRWRLLEMVHSLALPDCWIAAGFVRNAVWDHLHGRAPGAVATDIDVIWFDPQRCTPEEDQALEARLRKLDAPVTWSVKNQARMHIRNGDEPYLCATHAMRFWPETATAVAVRLGKDRSCEIAAPFGLDDLFGLVLRHTWRFAGEKNAIYQERLKAKNWLATWPLLELASEPSAAG